jgi:hypothetical protein
MKLLVFSDAPPLFRQPFPEAFIVVVKEGYEFPSGLRQYSVPGGGYSPVSFVADDPQSGVFSRHRM